jgi:hypothetical protein
MFRAILVKEITATNILLIKQNSRCDSFYFCHDFRKSDGLVKTLFMVRNLPASIEKRVSINDDFFWNDSGLQEVSMLYGEVYYLDFGNPFLLTPR